MLAGCGHGEKTQGIGADFVAAVGIENGVDDASNRKALIDQLFAHGEPRRNLGNAQAFRLHRGKGFVFVDFVHRTVTEILGQGRFERPRIVPILHDRHGHGGDFAFLGQRPERMVAPLSRDNLKAFAIGPHQQGLDNTERADGWQKIGNILAALLPDIEGGEFELFEG